MGSSASYAGSISDFNKFAWSENVGWLNFKSSHEQVTVYKDHVEGYIWSENIGWIRMGTHTGGGNYTYSNDSADSYGVNINNSGKLSGYAWGENIGWVNFNPSHSQVSIDSVSGDFDGYAWAENIGWVHLKHKSPSYKVTQILNLISEISLPVDLDKNGGLSELIHSSAVVGSNNKINLNQDLTTGYLDANTGTVIFLLRPVKVELFIKNFTPGIFVTEDGLIRIVSDAGTQVTSLAEPQNMDELTDVLSNRGLNIEQKAYGLLQISLLTSSSNSETWYAARVDYGSAPSEQCKKAELSVRTVQEPLNKVLFDHCFYKDGIFYQQTLHPSPANWNRLKAYLKAIGNVSMDTEGFITLQTDNTTYRAIMDYQIESSNERLGQVELFAIGDQNADGLEDYHVVYPNGEKQILYLLEIKQ